MKPMIVISLVLALMAGATSVYASEADYQISGPYADAKFTYQTIEEGKLLISAVDADDKPILGLTQDEFVIRKGAKTAHILSVESLQTSKAVGLKYILVVDNSFSMRLRDAITPLTSALEVFYASLRPIDHVTVIVFDERDTITVNGRPMRAKVLESNQVDRMRAFMADSMDRRGLTDGTYLFEAMLAGVDRARRMPPQDNKFMIVFSDGEDINSRITPEEVEQSARGIDNFAIYAVDYMPTPTLDPFLRRLTAGHGGYAWKAGSADELLGIFEAFSSTILHRYVVTYRFVDAPAGTLAFADPRLTIEEITTIDSSPLLNHIFFETGKSELTDRYRLFETRAETNTFDERALRDGMEKYGHVLNIIGKRMRSHPEATLRLVGCNADVGEEQGRIDLSRGRAEAVQAYLRYVWAIAPERMAVEQRNLPEAPSNPRTPQGRIDNQRVEIYSDHPAILDTVNSEYVTKVSDMETLRLLNRVQSEAGMAEWQVTLFCGSRDIHSLLGRGDLPGEWAVALDSELLEHFSACDRIDARILGLDNEGNALDSRAEQGLPVNFIQRTQQMAQVQGYRVKEQYALILFDFDSAVIKERNAAIVDRIIDRLKKVPEAIVAVVGHTDNIGSEAYNLQLSERRARAVEQALIKAAAPSPERLLVSGAGPNQPLYDNDLPEGRALNRTVTVTLEYFQQP